MKIRFGLSARTGRAFQILGGLPSSEFIQTLSIGLVITIAGSMFAEALKINREAFMIFSIIGDSVVIIRHKFVYKQVSAYNRNGKVYARHAGGFVRVHLDGRTSHPDVKWEQIDVGFGEIDPDRRKPSHMEVLKHDA